MLQRPTRNRASSWWHLKQRTDRLQRIWKPTLLRLPLKKRLLKKASITNPKCSPVSATTMNDPATTGTRGSMPKHPGTGHSVYSPTGDHRFPPPWSEFISCHTCPPLPAALVGRSFAQARDDDTCCLMGTRRIERIEHRHNFLAIFW